MVRLIDDGDGGGVLSRPLTLYVLPVNDRPSFEISLFNIEATEVMIATTGTFQQGVVTNIQKGGWNEEGQKIIFSIDVMYGPERLFVPLQIECSNVSGWSTCEGVNGDFRAVPRPRRFGEQVVQVRVLDDGTAPNYPDGKAPYENLTHGNLGAPQAMDSFLAPQNLTLRINMVDDPPEFVLATDRVRVLQDSACVSIVPQWDGLSDAACARSSGRRCVTFLCDILVLVTVSAVHPSAVHCALLTERADHFQALSQTPPEMEHIVLRLSS